MKKTSQTDITDDPRFRHRKCLGLDDPLTIRQQPFQIMVERLFIESFMDSEYDRLPSKRRQMLGEKPGTMHGRQVGRRIMRRDDQDPA
jgi:hypothetical protein